ncbi:MAG: hypothetical protein WC889_20625 [Myxococcota bacterium]
MFSKFTDALYAFASKGALKDEVVRARAEFFEALRDVTEDEEFYDERINAFLEWYCIDRTIGQTGRTPLDMYLESGGLDGEAVDFFAGFASARLSLYRIGRVDGVTVAVRDVFTLVDSQVVDDRPLIALKKGDLVETRLIRVAGVLHFSSTFMTHPKDVRKLILREVKTASRERRLDVPAFLRNLGVLWVRNRRYSGINAAQLYTPEALSRPNVRPLKELADQ